MNVLSELSTDINIWRCYVLCVQGPWLSYSLTTLPQHQGCSKLPISLPAVSVPSLREAFQRPCLESPPPPCLCPSSSRPEKTATAGGDDTVLTHHPDTVGLKLEKEGLSRKLRHETCGGTQLGSFILDSDSLYVDALHSGAVIRPLA
nr:mucin-16-like [Equus asinus]